MNRIDRISAILIQLQTRRVVKAQEIADRFGISLRTVYRDVKALEEAGVPVIGEAGLGYSLVEGYRLPPVMFTREEAIAFLTAEKLVEKLTDTSTSSNYKSAMYKIKAVLRTSERDFLENLDAHIEVLKSRRQSEGIADFGFIQTILKSIAERKVLAINYFTHYRQTFTQRCIEPVGVFYLDSFWHLFAFCKMRNDYRDFRLDRISDLKITDEGFHKEHPSLRKYLEQLYEDRELQEVVIQVEKRTHLFLESQKYYHGFVSETEKDDFVEMSFLTAHLEAFARWFLMYGDKATIVTPTELKDRVGAILESVASNLSLARMHTP
ncbi:YafY family protein [Pedobacter sp. SYSU D00535]|uniref:helix-turn-helix transcriptional regulator n=1 Tax=Pedobacter sp. SYSU D00535 TaxID=2810308 RepID=UPI001A976930|nr:YafY family protein [Pedobacter sp. SYSU D00535]